MQKGALAISARYHRASFPQIINLYPVVFPLSLPATASSPTAIPGDSHSFDLQTLLSYTVLTQYYILVTVSLTATRKKQGLLKSPSMAN